MDAIVPDVVSLLVSSLRALGHAASGLRYPNDRRLVGAGDGDSDVLGGEVARRRRRP